MTGLEKKRFESPEETRTFANGKGKVDLLGVGQLQPEVALRRPGRRWHLAKVALEKYWLRRWF